MGATDTDSLTGTFSKLEQYGNFEQHADLARPSRVELIRLYSRYTRLTEHLHVFAKSEFKEYSHFLEDKGDFISDDGGPEILLLAPFLPIIVPVAASVFAVDKTIDAGRDLIDMPKYYAERDRVRKALKSGDIEPLLPRELIEDLRRSLIEYSRTQGELIAMVENGSAAPPPRGTMTPERWLEMLKAEKRILKSPEDIQAMSFSALTAYADRVNNQGTSIEYHYHRPERPHMHHDC
jgi:hypothetical protein